jgi:hypothetical protein
VTGQSQFLTGSPEIRMRTGGSELVAADETVSIGGTVFDLGLVDRVIYRAFSRVNQASYLVGLSQGGMRRKVMFDAYGAELGDAREAWERLVGLLETAVCPRIADDAVRAISAAGVVRFGSRPTARIEADAEGLRHVQPFARTVPWALITGADLADGLARVWVTGRKPRLSIDMSGWNAVALPRVVGALTGR